jgi:hypothetical protein
MLGAIKTFEPGAMPSGRQGTHMFRNAPALAPSARLPRGSQSHLTELSAEPRPARCAVMPTSKLRLFTALCGALLLAPPAFAATPDGGTVSPGTTDLTYTVPAAPLPNTSAPADGNYTCDTTNPCDEFALTVDLPSDYLDHFPDAAVHVAAATDVENLDIDLQVSDQNGAPLYSMRDNPPAQPSVTIYPNGGTTRFIVQVVPGTPHSGASVSITLVPGEEAKSLIDVFGGALPPAMLLPLFAAALLRRRRA